MRWLRNQTLNISDELLQFPLSYKTAILKFLFTFSFVFFYSSMRSFIPPFTQSMTFKYELGHPALAWHKLLASALPAYCSKSTLQVISGKLIHENNKFLTGATTVHTDGNRMTLKNQDCSFYQEIRAHLITITSSSQQCGMHAGENQHPRRQEAGVHMTLSLHQSIRISPTAG